MRLVLVIAGFVLFAGGMLSLLVSDEIASGHGWQLNEMGVWGILLVSIVPGILLVFGGIMTDEQKGHRIGEFIVLAVSIVIFFLLTTVVMYF